MKKKEDKKIKAIGSAKGEKYHVHVEHKMPAGLKKMMKAKKK